MTDASGAQLVKLSGFDMPKLGVLNINAIHAGLHYGSFVTYLRLKNIVPPTSEPGSGRRRFSVQERGTPDGRRRPQYFNGKCNYKSVGRAI
jgi:hypothetical protein